MTRRRCLRTPRFARGAAVFFAFCTPCWAQDVGAGGAPTTLEVTARGNRGEAQRLQESAEAVNVVDVRKAKQQTVDLGEVLARTQGIGVRREGGLGSDATLSLNGLQGDQVRLFLDGVPLHLAGYPFGIVNVPVNLVERIEVYRGVVPIRFGADALGGAINLVTDRNYKTHLGVSYQEGSFGTVRATVNGRYRHEPTGLILGLTSFFDRARNDYWMDDRELPNPDGSSVVKSVRRFHDAYGAYGGNLEVGVVDKKWARKLLFQVFFATFDKELQHNAVMSLPYGAVTHGETTYGAAARYEVSLQPGIDLELLANYGHRRIDFRDLSEYKYKWTGELGKPVGRAGAQGEIRGEAIDESIYEDSVFSRVGLSWALDKVHTLRTSVTPELTHRIGDDHVEDRVDLLGLHDRRLQIVGGVEHELTLFDERLSNVAFGKAYYLRADHEQIPEGRVTQTIFEQSKEMHAWGVGDAFRYRFASWILGKISYEYATRLPTADELFGNGVLVDSNIELRPERSHNLNLGPRLDLKRTPYGDFGLDINGFLREANDQIVLLAGKQFIPYANIADMRGLGLESAASWISPGRWIGLDGSFTWQDLRNTSNDGPFAAMKGMRIPSRPYMFASWGARFHVGDLPDPDDALETFYFGRYVHGFDRGWAIGDPEFKIRLPAQVSHSAGVTWLLSHSLGRLTSTFEIDNLTDAKLYDTFGVQRPGRALYLKLTGQI